MNTINKLKFIIPRIIIPVIIILGLSIFIPYLLNKICIVLFNFNIIDWDESIDIILLQIFIIDLIMYFIGRISTDTI
jgi:hypothetical protein